MPEIKISVKNKIATAEHGAKFVCGNSDYTIKFDFDEEWSGHSLKTALFVFKGQLVPVAFDGNECKAPIIRKATLLGVGVKSSDGELRTTTPAYIPCDLSSEDIANEEIEEPTPSVYDEIISLINAGMVKGEKGEKGEKGDKGDAGAIKFMAVTSLPTENIATDAIYLLPMPDGTGENIFAEYVYIDGKWEVLGSVALNVDHSEYVKFEDFDEQTIESLTNNKYNLNDTQKASACDWMGAIKNPKPEEMSVLVFTGGGTGAVKTYGYTVVNPYQGQFYRLAAEMDGDTIQGTGYFLVNNPTRPYHAANKKYVDDTVGEIDTVLDNIIALQNSLIGGNV